MTVIVATLFGSQDPPVFAGSIVILSTPNPGAVVISETENLAPPGVGGVGAGFGAGFGGGGAGFGGAGAGAGAGFGGAGAGVMGVTGPDGSRCGGTCWPLAAATIVEASASVLSIGESLRVGD